MLKRRRGTIIAILGVIGLTYVLYINTMDNQPNQELNADLVNHVTNLKGELDKSEKTIKTIEDRIKVMEKKRLSAGQGAVIEEEIPAAGNKPIVIKNRGDQSQKSYEVAVMSPNGGVCSLAEAPTAKTDIQMYNVLNTISFMDVDGGVWKQGFDIKYSESDWTSKSPLKVFVIPHSHDDPGWLKTFDGYFESQVKHILDNMVTKLGQYTDLKFIYAEISFFSHWWKRATDDQKQAVKRYISEGRLELVAGGWVMPDEAASNYFAIIDQLIEGHDWIRQNIGEDVKPQSGWSIDPFGHTPTMAYILKQSGLKNMLIQRVHYSIKKYFAENKYLEFNWRQPWDQEGNTDILCHMMPFYSYDVPHTCGPNPKICCQFDFNRLPGGKHNCPWREPPQVITDSNVHARARTLLDQYRKKSKLYRSNVVLIPLGDDFRYDTAGEWDKQYTNYRKLFEHMNSQAEWNVKAQFGTLSDYFKELRSEVTGSPEMKQSSLPNYPTLSGDFYTYADRADHYWSGYFTSRPFYKHWDRHLEVTLRSAEVIFSIAQAVSAKIGQSGFPAAGLYDDLTYARRALGLYQHHDGVTGTAKTAVNNDYGQRMLDGWKGAYKVIRQSAQLLLNNRHESTEMLDMDWIKDQQDSLEVKKKHHIPLGDSKKFVIYNSSPQDREEVVRIWVATVPVSVYDSQSQPTICQVSPYFTDETTISDSTFKLSFLAKVPALGLATYTIKSSEDDPCTISQVQFYSNHQGALNDNPVFKPVDVADSDQIEISNDQISVSVSAETGMVQSVLDKKQNKPHRLEMDFITYKSDAGGDHGGGAYLFFPKGTHQPLYNTPPLIRVIKGNLIQEVQSISRIIQHVVRVVNTPGVDSLGFEVVNTDFLKPLDNTELVMQFLSDIDNSDLTWYTDMNGFTMNKRKYQPKIPLQGNVYPMTSSSYLEDQESRLTVHTSQSAGVLSTETGELQVWLDRRLNQDDNRGLGEPIKDSKHTETRFFVIIERKLNPSVNDKPSGYPSITSAVLYRHFLSPLITLPVISPNDNAIKSPVYKPLTKPWPCELHLLNLRALRPEESRLSYSQSLLLVHNQANDCSVETRGLSCSTADGKLDITDMFRDLSLKSYERRSLTNLEALDDKSSHQSSVQISPMNINAYKLTLN